MGSNNLNMWAGSGLAEVVTERNHQFELGYDIKHDAEHHTPEELFSVGRCYVDFGVNDMDGHSQDEPHPFWPETSIPWKPEVTSEGYIIKGMAFILAAMDLQRALEVTGQ